MAPRKPKHEIITFKADRSLLDAMQGITNRSEFIRSAVLAALDHLCPLCQGTGVMTPNQQRHWKAFTERHALRECDECHERHLVCDAAADEHAPHE